MANVSLGIQDSKLLSNAHDNNQKFGIADMAVVIELLTKLYANPIRTLTQEYICNGRDANREVNATRPLEITAPAKFNPIMFIRDFGPGLTPERVKETFLYYGASTKRSDNGQTGGFGIGGKSAWAYTDSFVITTFVDGVKRSYVAHKSQSNGNLDLVSTESTKEPNGTEIQIAVKPQDCQDFKNAIYRATRFWDKSEKPIVKGLTPEEIVQDIEPLFSINGLELRSDIDANYVVVDGIPYAAKSFLPELQSMLRRYFIVRIPNGMVRIAPTREDLIDNTLTTKYLKGVSDTYTNIIKSHLDNAVMAQKNGKESAKTIVKYNNMLNYKFDLKDYTLNFGELCLKAINSRHIGSRYGVYRGKYKKTEIYSIPLTSIDNLFYNDIPKEPATKINWRLKKVYNDSNNKNLDVVLLDPTIVPDSILKDLEAKPISSIDASDYSVNRTYSPKTGQVVKKDICIHLYEEYKLNPTQVDLNKLTDIIVYDLKDSATYAIRGTIEEHLWQHLLPKGYKFGFIAEGSLNLVKNDPKFIPVAEFRSNYKATKEQLLEHAKHCLLRDNDYHELLSLDKVKKEITNKTILGLLEIYSTKEYRQLPKELVTRNEKQNIISFINKHNNYIKDKLPLIKYIDTEWAIKDKDAKPEFLKYINSK